MATVKLDQHIEEDIEMLFPFLARCVVGPIAIFPSLPTRACGGVLDYRMCSLKLES